MSLIYRFRKEQLEDGSFISRPRILVVLKGKKALKVLALIDSGSDVTVIPKRIANIVGLDESGERTILYGYRESTEAVKSKVTITFLGRAERQSVTLPNIPILIALGEDDFEKEDDITLGVKGIFDAFDINFRKSQNRIIFKEVSGDLMLREE